MSSDTEAPHEDLTSTPSISGKCVGFVPGKFPPAPKVSLSDVPSPPKRGVKRSLSVALDNSEDDSVLRSRDNGQGDLCVDPGLRHDGDTSSSSSSDDHLDPASWMLAHEVIDEVLQDVTIEESPGKQASDDTGESPGPVGRKVDAKESLKNAAPSQAEDDEKQSSA